MTIAYTTELTNEQYELLFSLHTSKYLKIISKFNMCLIQIYKKWQKIIIFVLVLFVVFKINSSPVYPQSDFQNKCKTGNTTKVCLDEQYLFSIEGKYKENKRNQIISKRILKIAQDKSKDINSLTMEETEAFTKIVLGEELVLTLTEKDAKTAQKRQELAKDYIERIKNAIKQYREEDEKIPGWSKYLLTLLGTLGMYIFSYSKKNFEDANNLFKKLFSGLNETQLAWINLIIIILLGSTLSFAFFTPDNTHESILAGASVDSIFTVIANKTSSDSGTG